MALQQILISSAFLLTGCALPAYGQAAGEANAPVIRLAEIEIDVSAVDAYRAALKEEIEASIRLEPGVLTLYAVAVKDHPTQIRLFERYANPAAYQAHRQTAHFLKYKAATQEMVKSLRLIEAEPILLGAKPPERSQ